MVKDAAALIQKTKVVETKIDTTFKDETEKEKRTRHDKQKTFEIETNAAQNKSIFKSMQLQERKNQIQVASVLIDFGLKMVLLGIRKRLFTKEMLEGGAKKNISEKAANEEFKQ